MAHTSPDFFTSVNIPNLKLPFQNIKLNLT